MAIANVFQLLGMISKTPRALWNMPHLKAGEMRALAVPCHFSDREKSLCPILMRKAKPPSLSVPACPRKKNL